MEMDVKEIESLFASIMNGKHKVIKSVDVTNKTISRLFFNQTCFFRGE